MRRATLRYGGFTMDVEIGRTPPPVLYIPKPPVTPQYWIAERVSRPEHERLPVLEFTRAKPLDEFGFHWEYHFSKES